MPSGRIVFISERRGGYLRCGRTCPTYTLFDMAADGSDIRTLSYHDTNEWHPSVARDGTILFTRWDYVDRHGFVAHHPWTIRPDGTDPRAVYGNYSFRYQRADMQVHVRTIPGSHRHVWWPLRITANRSVRWSSSIHAFPTMTGWGRFAD